MVLMGHFAVTIESFYAFLKDGNEREAAYFEELLLVITPENLFVSYQLARRYATKNIPKKCLEHLERVLALGWTDKEFIRNTKGFYPLGIYTAFIVLLEGNK